VPLAIVLHTHMPYVEGYGTWPFGEEWLWEAMATSYLPLLDVLDAAPELTLSLTPVLADQLAAPGVPDRFLAFLREVRTETHRRDVAAAGEDGPLAAELARSAAEYERAGQRFAALGGDLLGALAPHAAWTSSATHAVLPLLATDAGVRLQVRTGIEAHRARVARPWRGGLWSPECAHAPWLDPLLEAEGVHATCVDLTAVLGRGAPGHLRPVRTQAGPLAVPIDREVVELVWSDGGYPAGAPYRDSHAKTAYEHKPWRNDGGVYDPAAATEHARADAAHFVARVAERLAGAGDDALCVCALDTELLGHWWYEGPAWLAAVAERCREDGVELVHLDDALERVAPADPPPGGLPVTTWGRHRDLSTWSGPAVADLAWAARDAELRAVARAGEADATAVRELLALQASDWAFVVSEDTAAPYGRERAAAHREAFDRALAGTPGAGPRALAPRPTPAALREV
jgi:1,4-alpha-glucan branching enzyme